MRDRARFLAAVYIFSCMKKPDLRRIAKHAKCHSFKGGEVIIRDGHSDNRLLIITKGQVEVVRNETSLGIFGPFSYFGEIALVDDFIRSETVLAKVDTEVLSLHRRDLCKEIKRSSVIAMGLLQMLSRRIRAIEKTMMKSKGAFLNICASCKMIRETSGNWTPIEEYIRDHSEIVFSHGICPECAIKLYDGFFQSDHYHSSAQER
jgi:CRP-like cAMP-binding protein